MAEPIITFKNVSKTYILYKNDQARFKALFFKPKNPKTNKALNNVSFEICRGESVGIVGDNGAGKSTLLKMITGVAFPDSGDIVVNGKQKKKYGGGYKAVKAGFNLTHLAG